jgi:ribosomal protein S18 acetylase RimI-like enzyme
LATGRPSAVGGVVLRRWRASARRSPSARAEGLAGAVAGMLAYVFWHAAAAGIDPEGYEERLAAFHAALAARGVPGLAAHWAERVRDAPWLQGPGYADWYVVRDFAALGELNRLAVSGVAQAPHAAVAAWSDRGAGSLLALVRGEVGHRPVWRWVARPRGLPYDAFYAAVPAAATLWRRQLVLGAVPEFALAGDGPTPAGQGVARTEHALVWEGPPPPPLRVVAAGAADRAWLGELWRSSWGGDVVVARGLVHRLAELDALVAWRGAERVGGLTYRMAAGACEVVTVDAAVRGAGVGTALLAELEALARRAGCARLWLVTSNDNLAALRFYQRRGYRIAAVHVGAVDAARRRKPSIPVRGEDGIAVHDELELEKRLT